MPLDNIPKPSDADRWQEIQEVVNALATVLDDKKVRSQLGYVALLRLLAILISTAIEPDKLVDQACTLLRQQITVRKHP